MLDSNRNTTVFSQYKFTALLLAAADFDNEPFVAEKFVFVDLTWRILFAPIDSKSGCCSKAQLSGHGIPSTDLLDCRNKQPTGAIC